MGKAANVLFILTDDQGPWAMGCAGNEEIRTPHLDRLAAGGARCTRFFCSSPVCSPARASLLTGRLPSQHGVHDWIRQGNVGADAVAFLQDEVAYTDLLAARGWNCGLSGKWHLGHSQLTQHGFGHWYVHQTGGGDYNRPPMIRDGRRCTEEGYVTRLITDDALAFLDRHAGAGPQAPPFYLGVHYTAPHSPWTGHPPEIVASYDACPFDSCPQEQIHPWAVGHRLTEASLGNRAHLQGYFAAVTAMDAQVGRLLDRLDALGLRDDTLVLFTSDNGFSCGHHGFWGKGNGTYPLNMYDNSVLVPFLASHPGRIPSGLRIDALHNAFDLFPTLLDYLGLPPVADGVDRPGRSFAPALTGGGGTGHEAVVVDGGVPGCGAYAEYGAARMVRTGEWKYVDRGEDQPAELYHLSEDPQERHNLAGDQGCRRRRDELQGVLHDWFSARITQAQIDGRRLPVTGGGQLRPLCAGGTITGADAFAAR